MKLNDRNTRCEEKKNTKKLKFNKWREDEDNECKNELNKIERLEVKLRKDSVKGCEKNDKLSLKMKIDYAKPRHD